MNRIKFVFVAFVFFIESIPVFATTNLLEYKPIISLTCTQFGREIVCNNFEKYTEVNDTKTIRKIRHRIKIEEIKREMSNSSLEASKELVKYIMSSDAERLRIGYPQFNIKYLNGKERYKTAKAVEKALKKAVGMRKGKELTAEEIFNSFDTNIKQYVTYDQVKTYMDISKEEAMAAHNSELSNGAGLVAGAVGIVLIAVTIVIIADAASDWLDEDEDEDEDEDDIYPVNRDSEGPEIKIKWPKPADFGDNGDSTPSRSEGPPLQIGGSKPDSFDEEITNPGLNNEETPIIPIEIPPRIPQQVEEN